MTHQPRYSLRVSHDRIVGPHSLDVLKKWAGVGAIGTDWLVRREGQLEWIALAEAPRFANFSEHVRNEVARLVDDRHRTWSSEPATLRQLERLEFFGIPFTHEGLTKLGASLLIDAFAELDPERLQEYEESDCTAAQLDEIRSLGGNTNSVRYSRCAAREEIWNLRKKRETEAIDAMIFANDVNDTDLLDICHYTEASVDELRELRSRLDARCPNWSKLEKYEFGYLVAQLFAGDAC
jgi:hypothetical protein